jgi:hypothetical protein
LTGGAGDCDFDGGFRHDEWGENHSPSRGSEKFQASRLPVSSEGGADLDWMADGRRRHGANRARA